MDITRSFKATIKTVRMRKKITTDDGSEDGSLKGIIKGKTNTQTTFKQRSKEIAKNVTKLKDIIIENCSNFLGVAGLTAANSVEAHEQDKVDEDIQFFMKSCSKSIIFLKNEIGSNKNQLSTHRKAVIQLLEEYLKAVCKVYGQQKAIRVKRAVDRKKMSRLSYTLGSENEPEKKKPQTSTPNKKTNDHLVTETTSAAPDAGLENLSKEEIQMFEEENKVLLNELNDLVDEVKQIEGKVIEISQLQEIFSEKVLDQSSQIEKVNETTTSTTENVKEGNENIREAIKNSATFRVWILFLLVMCTFSLLFLDWYNQ